MNVGGGMNQAEFQRQLNELVNRLIPNFRGDVTGAFVNALTQINAAGRTNQERNAIQFEIVNTFCDLLGSALALNHAKALSRADKVKWVSDAAQGVVASYNAKSKLIGAEEITVQATMTIDGKCDCQVCRTRAMEMN